MSNFDLESTETTPHTLFALLQDSGGRARLLEDLREHDFLTEDLEHKLAAAFTLFVECSTPCEDVANGLRHAREILTPRDAEFVVAHLCGLEAEIAPGLTRRQKSLVAA